MLRHALAIVGLLVVAGFTTGVMTESRRPPNSSRPVVRREYRELCVLKAKFGNAGTFVRPTPRPEAGTLAGGATVNVTYVGFDAFPGAQAAFQYAVDIWRASVDSPVTVTLEAQFTPLDPGQLGSAGANFTYVDFAGGIPSVFYGDPLADRIAGADQGPGDFDILASFADQVVTWYFGTDGNTPPGQYDFVSVVLHELGHGFGFSGSAYVVNQAIGDVGGITSGDIPDAFDLFTVTHTGASLLGFPNETLALAAPLLSAYNSLDPLGPGVYWAGAAGKAANGGVRPRLYTPAAWEQGSSYSHLEEQAFPEGNPNSLMTHLLAAAEAIHDPGPIVLGMFDDMGWNGRPELITNGSFSGGMTGWTPFASVTNSLGATSQNNNYIPHTVTNGVLEFTRVGPTPPDTATSAVVLQNTGAPFGAGEQMVATFQAANSSTVRKRLSVLMHDQDFSDLSVCTFWLEPFTPLLTYKMLTHTTKAWTGATISLYAANAGSNGGAYRIDNVSLRAAPTAVAAETRCIDPWFWPYDTTPDFPEMLGNTSFSSVTLPPWQTFGTLTHQVSSGVFEFTRDSSAGAAGVLLQPTGQNMGLGAILTARFELGNSSAVRKRVTVLLHDLDFSDLSACTFWLAPGQALTPYVMRAYATEAWGNATLSIYAASVGVQQWTRVDNASFKWTPSTPNYGVDCGEPGSAIVAGRSPVFMNTFGSSTAMQR